MSGCANVDIAAPLIERAVDAGLLKFDASGRQPVLTRSGRALLRSMRCLATTERARSRTRSDAIGNPRKPAQTGASPRSRAGKRRTRPEKDLAILSQENGAESPLAWLRRRLDRDGQPMITQVQFDAGERLSSDFWRARMTPRVTMDWSGIGRSRKERRGMSSNPGHMSDGVAAAHQRVTRALAAVGPEFADILIDVCGHMKGLVEIERREAWPQRSAKLILQKALTALARHYGLLVEELPDIALKRRLRHWGTSDYRPTLDHWA
jgi:hypothetical protein